MVGMIKVLFESSASLNSFFFINPGHISRDDEVIVFLTSLKVNLSKGGDNLFRKCHVCQNEWSCVCVECVVGIEGKTTNNDANVFNLWKDQTDVQKNHMMQLICRTWIFFHFWGVKIRTAHAETFYFLLFIYLLYLF